jgi:hypothetical protein
MSKYSLSKTRTDASLGLSTNQDGSVSSKNTSSTPRIIMFMKSKTKGKLNKTGHWSKKPSIECGSKSSVNITDVSDYQKFKYDLN